MTPSISVATATYSGEMPHLVNLFNSLEDLAPDEVCIVDTTVGSQDQMFWLWLVSHNIKVRYRPWDGSYSRAKNAALEMCSSDWTLMLDSDEMLTREAARDMRYMLDRLPEHVLCVRFPRITLLDNLRCLHPWEWPPFRPGAGMHPRIAKTGCGKYVGDVHERFEYPGRQEVGWLSEDHPKWDWRGYYFLHNWLYLDNPLRRRWGKVVDLRKIPRRGVRAQYRAVQDMIVMPRPQYVGLAPNEEVTWQPIEWEVDPSQWTIVWDKSKGQFVYDRNRRYRKQAQR